MSHRVLAIGVSPIDGDDERNPVIAFPAMDGPPAIAELGAAVHACIDASGYAIGIVPGWLGDEPATRLDVAGSALGARRLAVHVTYLPPLAAGVLATLAGRLAERIAPGALLAALPRVESNLRVFAWLRGIGGLSDPRPGVLHRAISALPGSSFVVASWPQPRIFTLRRHHPALGLPALEDGVAVAVASRNSESSRLLDALASTLGDAPVTELEPSPHGPSWWGTTGLVEAVAYPLAPETLALQLEGEISLQSCRWCGEWVAQSPCPFCGSAAGAEP